MNEQLIQLAIAQAPAAVAGLKAIFKKLYPDLPAPTDAEARAAYIHTFSRELGIDDDWLAAHPNWQT